MKEKDLESAASYIYRDSPVYAASFVDRVLEAGRSLDAFAERGRVVPKLSTVFHKYANVLKSLPTSL
jgi:plasmid stabilization system protein ParE